MSAGIIDSAVLSRVFEKKYDCPFLPIYTKHSYHIIYSLRFLTLPLYNHISVYHYRYNIYLEELDRYYYLKVTAPDGFLFTSGVCNDDVSGWECDYSTNERNRSRRRRVQEGANDNEDKSYFENALGIKSGRSTKCVYVGYQDGTVQAPVNFGVMRVGDHRMVRTKAALVLKFDDEDSNLDATTTAAGRRELANVLRRARVLDENDDGTTIITTRYLLDDEQYESAIGTVTAEVLASELDGRLAEKNVHLMSVDPSDVFLLKSHDSNSGDDISSSTRIAVVMDITAHHLISPIESRSLLGMDFDLIIQDSINRDTPAMHRGLREYNQNCLEQKYEGLNEEDYGVVVSTSGAARPGGRPSGASNPSQLNGVFSKACSAELLLPDYFETHLAEIEVRSVSEVVDLKCSGASIKNIGQVASIVYGFVLICLAYYV